MKRPMLWVGAGLIGLLAFFITGRAVQPEVPLFILNPGAQTQVVYVGPARHTVMHNELVRASLSPGAVGAVRVRSGEATTELTPPKAPAAGEVLVLDLSGAAGYVLLDLSPQYNPRKPPGPEGFTPKVLGLSEAGRWHRFRVGPGVAWGPFEDPEWDRARAQAMRGRPILKLMRVATASASWDAAAELAEAAGAQLRDREPVRWLELDAPRR